MNDVFLKKIFSSELLNTPFTDYDEYLNTELSKVKMILNSYLEAHKDGTFDKNRASVLKNLDMADNFISSRLKASGEEFFTGEYLKKIYELNALEWFCVLVGVLIKLDKSCRELLLKIENGNSGLSYNTVLKLYFFTPNTLDIKGYYKIFNSLTRRMNSLCFKDGELVIDERVFDNIISNSASSSQTSEMSVRLPEEKSEPLIIRENLVQKIFKFIKNFSKSNTKYFYITGLEGIGKKTIVQRVCDILEKSLVTIDFKHISLEKSVSSVFSAYRETLFERGYICLQNFEKVSENNFADDNYIDFILSSASNYSKVVFVLANKSQDEFDKLRKYFENYCFIEIPLDDLDNEESFILWKNALNKVEVDDKLDIHEMANKFTFTPKQINNTVVQAQRQVAWNMNKGSKTSTSKESNLKIDMPLLCDVAYKQITWQLSDKATLIKKKHAWDELVMRKSEKEIIRRACNQIKYKHIVYDKWGMDKRILYGRGLSMLFTGPPGTGKTMAAQVVASELGLEIYKVDLSKVISKYIGESEKNLGEVFESAKRSNVILLFDETDALFGKRTEVKDSHDKNANVETSYLLQKMEEYNGITIMTTNFIENIDKAFFRRINYVIHFTFPDEKLRKEIWIKMFPKETPVSKDVDFDFLSKNFEIAGGNIKNVVLTATFMAASESSEIKMCHIIKALEYEMKKQGKIVSKNDFGEYGYLI